MTRKPLCKVFAAGCTPDGGISRYSLSEDGKLTFDAKLPLDRPMYFIRDGDRWTILLRAPDGFDGGSACLSVAKDLDPATLTVPIPTNGVCACHLSVWNGDTYAVNYLSGSVTKIGYRTVTHAKKPGMLPGRQDAPHTHYIAPTGDGYLLCTDLGLDRVIVYDPDLSPVSFCEVPAGHGVRHLTKGKNGYWYSANELRSTVSVFRYETGKLTCLSTHSCGIAEGGNTAAAIRLSQGGNRLWVSQRGADRITGFSVEGDGAILRLAESFSSGGKSPRDFCLTPDERFFLCANEGGTLTVLDRSGTLLDSVPLPGALCVAAAF